MKGAAITCTGQQVEDQHAEQLAQFLRVTSRADQRIGEAVAVEQAEQGQDNRCHRIQAVIGRIENAQNQEGRGPGDQLLTICEPERQITALRTSMRKPCVSILAALIVSAPAQPDAQGERSQPATLRKLPMTVGG